MTKRREFIKKTVFGSAGVAIGGLGLNPKVYSSVMGSNDRINVAVIGIRNQGSEHIKNWCAIKDSHNVVIKTICDVDERLFASRSKMINESTGITPLTEWDMRRVFDDKDIDAVSIVTPDHWHALATILACQAGKHVYVEKPVCHNISEGRKMIDAGKKYRVHIQHGTTIPNADAVEFLHKAGIGKLYMARVDIFHRRDSYGMAPDSAPPAGFHYDMWLGPAPYRPYNEKRSHYCWHWYWDYGSGDTGNTGPHAIQIARVGLNKNEHPVSVYSTGGIYGLSSEYKGIPGVMGYGDVETYGTDRSTQETPNTQSCIFRYADGTILQVDTRGRYSNPEGANNILDGNLFFGTDGYMEYTNGWKAWHNWEKAPFAGAGIGERAGKPDRSTSLAPLYSNLLDVIRSGKDEDLINPIVGGYYTASLINMANISCRLGRALTFDNATEKFVNDPEANKMLTREYRAPYTVPGV